MATATSPVPLLSAAVIVVVGGLHVRRRRGSAKRGEGMGLDAGPLRIPTLRAHYLLARSMAVPRAS